jgi:hypothetical protein
MTYPSRLIRVDAQSLEMVLPALQLPEACRGGEEDRSSGRCTVSGAPLSLVFAPDARVLATTAILLRTPAASLACEAGQVPPHPPTPPPPAMYY